MFFTISNTEIKTGELEEDLIESKAGALVSFSGLVRDMNEGQPVASLEYEVYTALATSEGQKILSEALESFDILDAGAVHRAGHLQLSDTAVWIGVTARHRGAAFKACRWIIDEIKHRLPVWKKEHYVHAPAMWVQCHHHDHLHWDQKTRSQYFEAQANLPEHFSLQPEQFADRRVLVVGAGGLGSPALLQLAAAGIGSLGICDPDQVSLNNLQRQSLYTTADIGKFKADAAAAWLSLRNPFLKTIIHKCYLDESNADDIICNYDLVLDCSDNLATTFLLNEYCYQQGIDYVSASIHQIDGQILVLPFSTYQGPGPCMACLWPEQAGGLSSAACSQTGVLASAVQILGHLEAGEALKLLQHRHKDHRSPCMLLYQFENSSLQRLSLHHRPNCPLDQPPEQQHQTNESRALAENAPGPAESPGDVHSGPVNISIAAISELDPLDWQIIDIREDAERSANETNWQHEHIPCSSFQNPARQSDWESRLEHSKKTLLVCTTAARSTVLAHYLRSNGFTRVYSLNGGLQGQRLTAQLLF
ncbi:MAG: ThiF family adenylyltransferase [Acidobacteria bacterium]|nr:ThiF family adenylyltransferase [Acidobacteriota bacterium]